MAAEAMWEIAPELGYLVHEHGELRGLAERLPLVADDAGGPVRRGLEGRLRPILGWLEGELLPHLRWEEAVFHPEVERLTAAAPMAAVDRAERERVSGLVGRLRRITTTIEGEASREAGAEAEAILDALHRLVNAHVEREDGLIRSIVADGRGPVRRVRSDSGRRVRRPSRRSVPAPTVGS